MKKDEKRRKNSESGENDKNGKKRWKNGETAKNCENGKNYSGGRLLVFSSHDVHCDCHHHEHCKVYGHCHHEDSSFMINVITMVMLMIIVIVKFVILIILQMIALGIVMTKDISNTINIILYISSDTYTQNLFSKLTLEIGSHFQRYETQCLALTLLYRGRAIEWAISLTHSLTESSCMTIK